MTIPRIVRYNVDSEATLLSFPKISNVHFKHVDILRSIRYMMKNDDT